MSHDYIYTDNQVVLNRNEWSERHFVYQRMRCCGEALPHAAEHIELLNAAAQTLFGNKSSLTIKELQEATSKLIRYSGRRPDVPHIVEVRYYDNGEYICRINESSLYKQFSLRAIRPSGEIFASENCLGTIPTSAFQSELELMRRYLTNQASGKVVVARGRDNNILHIDGGTPIMMKGYDIVVATTPKSVTANLAATAATKINGYKTTIRDFSIDEAMEAEELLYVDERGITSLSQLNGHRYATIIAHNLAEYIAE